MSIGMRSRTATTGAIFRKSLRLSGRARLDHSVGQVSTQFHHLDVSEIGNPLDHNHDFD